MKAVVREVRWGERLRVPYKWSALSCTSLGALLAAVNGGSLIAARALMGAAGAFMMANSSVIVTDAFPRSFLFTDLANPTSNHIYKAVGYEPVCDLDEYEFGPI